MAVCPRVNQENPPLSPFNKGGWGIKKLFSPNVSIFYDPLFLIKVLKILPFK